MHSLPLLVGVLLASMLVGAVPALVTALKPHLQQRLNLDSERVDRLERMRFFLAWVAGMPLAGYLVDAVVRHDVRFDLLVGGCFGIAATVAFLGVTESPRWVGAASFALGLATSFLVVATVSLMPVAIPAACPAAALNAGFIGIGIGSFAPAGVLRRLERWFGLRKALLVLGLGALIPAAFVFAGLPSEPPVRDPATSSDFLHDPRFWLLAGMLVLYYPIESALDIWSGPFLQELGYHNRPGRMMLIGFWLSFLIARLAMYFLMGPRNEIWFLFLCTLTSAVVLGNLVGAYGASAGGTGFWFVGACYGPLLPGILGLLLEITAGGSPGLALGSVLAVAGLHDALAHPLMGRTMHARPVRTSMRIPLIMTLLMLAPLLIFGLVPR